jgi:hypothetical protein
LNLSVQYGYLDLKDKCKDTAHFNYIIEHCPSLLVGTSAAVDARLKKLEEVVVGLAQAVITFHAEEYTLHLRKLGHYYVNRKGDGIGKASGKKLSLSLVWWKGCTGTEYHYIVPPKLEA